MRTLHSASSSCQVHVKNQLIFNQRLRVTALCISIFHLSKARGIFFFSSLHRFLETEESCRPRIRSLVQRLSLCLYLYSRVCHMPPEKLKYNLDGRKLLWGEDVLTVAALRIKTGGLEWMVGERWRKEHLSRQGRLCLDLVLSSDI